jgi:hypothetical protein
VQSCYMKETFELPKPTSVYYVWIEPAGLGNPNKGGVAEWLWVRFWCYDFRTRLTHSSAVFRKIIRSTKVRGFKSRLLQLFAAGAALFVAGADPVSRDLCMVAAYSIWEHEHTALAANIQFLPSWIRPAGRNLLSDAQQITCVSFIESRELSRGSVTRSATSVKSVAQRHMRHSPRDLIRYAPHIEFGYSAIYPPETT